MSDLRHEPKGHLARYALWQFRDYLVDKGIGTLIVMILAGYLSYQVTRMVPTHARGAAEAYAVVAQQLLGNLVFVGALFATNGIVSDDRKLGYFRFLFAKPVRAWAFYAQKALVALAGYLVGTLLLIVLWRWFFRYPLSVSVLAVAALGFVLYAGLGFLLSTVVRTEWLSLIAVYVASMVAWMKWEHAPGLPGALVRILPPVHGNGVGALEHLAATGAPLDMTLALWVGGYGIAAFLLGILALTRRPLAS